MYFKMSVLYRPRVGKHYYLFDWYELKWHLEKHLTEHLKSWQKILRRSRNETEKYFVSKFSQHWDVQAIPKTRMHCLDRTHYFWLTESDWHGYNVYTAYYTVVSCAWKFLNPSNTSNILPSIKKIISWNIYKYEIWKASHM